MQFLKKGEHVSGTFVSVGWEKIAAALVKSGEVYLHEGEAITGVQIAEFDFGLNLRIERVVVGKSPEQPTSVASKISRCFRLRNRKIS